VADTESAARSVGRARVLVVDDHPVVRQGLKQLIDAQGDLAVHAEAGSVHEALQILRSSKPDAVLVDLSLEDASGMELIRDVKQRHPGVPVLVVSMHDEALYAERALKAGASGYIMKDAPTGEVLSALRRVLAGGLYLSEAMSSRMLQQYVGGVSLATGCSVNHLTDRELEIFEMIARGRSTREIAESLHLSPKTVETHRTHVVDKLNLKNSAELLRYAIHWLARDARS
jgi:DNA-binding NarL/FixJ family response regulator